MLIKLIHSDNGVLEEGTISYHGVMSFILFGNKRDYLSPSHLKMTHHNLDSVFRFELKMPDTLEQNDDFRGKLSE